MHRAVVTRNPLPFRAYYSHPKVPLVLKIPCLYCKPMGGFQWRGRSVAPAANPSGLRDT